MSQTIFVKHLKAHYKIQVCGRKIGNFLSVYYFSELNTERQKNMNDADEKF